MGPHAHRSTPVSENPAARRWFVGDLQGCANELRKLLELIGFRPGVDRLLPLGDLVNRGPDNVGCLRLLMELNAEAVLGNHDLHLLHTSRGMRRPGPLDTLTDVLEAPDRDTLLDWLTGQPFLRQHDDLWQVHAGLHPAWEDPIAALNGRDPFEADPAISFCTRVRTCDASGRLPSRSEDAEAAPFLPWDAFYRPELHGGRRVVFGHWSVRGRVVNERAVGLDTGCVWGRELTAWCPEEDRWVQVPAERSYQEPG